MIIINLFHKDPANSANLYILDMIVADLRAKFIKEELLNAKWHNFLAENGVRFMGSHFEVDDEVMTLARLKFFGHYL